MKSDSVNPAILTPAPVFVIAVTLVNFCLLWAFGLTAVLSWITAHAGPTTAIVWFGSFWLCFFGAGISVMMIGTKMAMHLMRLLFDGLIGSRTRVISN